jgi:hypothetical protein
MAKATGQALLVINGTSNVIKVGDESIPVGGIADLSAKRGQSLKASGSAGQVELALDGKPEQCSVVIYQKGSTLQGCYLDDEIKMKASLSGSSAAG